MPSFLFLFSGTLLSGVVAETTCDGVSLLQTHAKKKGDSEEINFEKDDEGWKGSQRFKRCWHLPEGAMSGCATEFGGPKDNPAISARHCAQMARDKGADTFDFQRGRKKCWLRRCGNADLQVITPVEGTRIKPWLTYSQYCGWNSEKQVEQDCSSDAGYGTSATSVVQHFDPPNADTCTRHLQFNHMKNSNLNGRGPGEGSETLRFKTNLPEIDLVIRSDEGYVPANPNMNDVFRGNFGQINLRQGTTTRFTFMFVETRGQQRVVVPSFLFSIFDIDQGKNCNARTSITAQGYSGYFVEHTATENGDVILDSDVIVSTNIDSERGGVSTTFISSQQGNRKDNPRDPLALTKEQARRTITLKYENVDNFALDFSVIGGNPRFGRNILFGGEANLNIVDDGNIIAMCGIGES